MEPSRSNSEHANWAEGLRDGALAHLAGHRDVDGGWPLQVHLYVVWHLVMATACVFGVTSVLHPFATCDLTCAYAIRA